jgi:hypothetical protein
MARCEGTTRSGDRCKREARPDSKFCHVHEPVQNETDGEEAVVEDLELIDLAPILLAGILTAGLVFFLRGLGKWIPRF